MPSRCQHLWELMAQQNTPLYHFDQLALHNDPPKGSPLIEGGLGEPPSVPPNRGDVRGVGAKGGSTVT